MKTRHIQSDTFLEKIKFTIKSLIVWRKITLCIQELRIIHSLMSMKNYLSGLKSQEYEVLYQHG